MVFHWSLCDIIIIVIIIIINVFFVLLSFSLLSVLDC